MYSVNEEGYFKIKNKNIAYINYTVFISPFNTKVWSNIGQSINNEDFALQITFRAPNITFVYEPVIVANKTVVPNETK